LCPMIFDYNIAAIDKAGFAESLTKCRGEMGTSLGGAVMEKPEHWHRRLLRTRCERPRRRATKRDYEFSPSDVDYHATRPWRSCPCSGGTVARFSRGVCGYLTLGPSPN
jgi:hypothetical protein